MVLISDLFTKPFDSKLQACATKNSGHISQNANKQGGHVSKIQTALRLLAENEPQLAVFTNKPEFNNDFAKREYGKGTADAVLYYKQSRSIINRSYQPQADNIVGIGTISQLDKDMQTEGKETLEEQRSAKLNLLIQETKTLGGFTHRGYLEKAKTLLSSFNLHLNIIDRRFPRIESPGINKDSIFLINPSSRSDIANVRIAAEKHTPGMNNVLRIIFCQFAIGNKKAFGTTEGGQKPLEGGSKFPDFILINVHYQNLDNCTLIHEMIHATGLIEHDPDSTSVFAESKVGGNRTNLKREHAKMLRHAFFSIMQAN